MPLTELRVHGYRSVLDLDLPLKRINVIVGPNGCGKSNVYKSITLLSAAAQGRLAQALAEEGGMPSVLWAGPRKAGPVRASIAIDVDDFEYELVLGLPTPSLTAFQLDPEIKEEHLRLKNGSKRTVLLERGVSGCAIRDADGRRNDYTLELDRSASTMAQLVDAHRYPHLARLARTLSSWRFYHQFRSDEDSRSRHPQVGVRTWALASDGSDLAAALQTILESGDAEALREGVAQAFAGAQLSVESSDGRFQVLIERPGILRPFSARELSDGTMRYLCLLAALLSPRPAPLIALNEPESNLHPSLLPALADLVSRASATSQVWITTHSYELARLIEEAALCHPIELAMEDGETRRVGQPKGRYFLAEERA